MGWLGKILGENSTTKYFIEYGRYLSNHIAHGIIALERLGATEGRVRQWINWYTNKLEEPSEKDHADDHIHDDPVTADDLEKVTGKRKHFYSILNYYNKKFNEDYGGDVVALVRSEFPKLSLGMQASLLHGVIQLGYGYAAQEPTIILEGLAYLRHSYSPVIFDRKSEDNDLNKFGKGDTDIVEVLYALKRDDDLYNHLVQRAEELRTGDWFAGGIQYKIRALSEKGDELIGYANKVKVPRDILGNPVLIADWIVQQILTVYAMAQAERQNDFVLLHGVTCAWSIRQVIPLLANNDALDSLRTLLCLLFAAYISAGGPRLTTVIDTSIQVEELEWAELIKRTISADTERDEHVYKLVQICHGLWKEPKNAQHGALYLTAAKTVVDIPFPPISPSNPRL